MYGTNIAGVSFVHYFIPVRSRGATGFAHGEHERIQKYTHSKLILCSIKYHYICMVV